jgi:hypothetical protein
LGFAENRRKFDSLCRQATAAQERDARVDIARKAIHFAVDHPTGYYSSDVLESIFLEIAGELATGIPEKANEGTILHVMTASYATGGHTRVAERWMELDSTRRHSLLFTHEEQHQVPTRLLNAVEKGGGTVTKLPDADDYMAKAAKLRALASGYEFVVLHVHMFDVIPLIAFGTEDFTRPVIFFNHADGLFSVGVSIADRFVDIDNHSARRSKQNRGIPDPFLLPIPMDVSKIKAEGTNDILRTLHLPPGRTIVATAGHPDKYIPYKKWNFSRLARGILENRERILLAIGPSAQSPHWHRMLKAFRGRVFTTGLIPYSDFKACLSISDIVIDSFPLSGGAAMVDAVNLGKPVLSLCTPDGQNEFIRNSPAYCASKAELFAKLDLLLSSSHERQKHVDAVMECLVATNSVSVWKERLEELYGGLAAQRHKLRKFRAAPNSRPTDIEIYLNRSNRINYWKFLWLDRVSAMTHQLFYRIRRKIAS